MKTLLINNLKGDDIERINRYLWVELLINPSLVETLMEQTNEDLLPHLQRAALWRISYRYYLDKIGAKNFALDQLIKQGKIKPASERLTRAEYNKHIREFLKGLEILWSRKS
ncbi:MAG: hypothetical protein D6710_02660 [Nitrospirae bacterium]|nr:MAG: hypothetical protein D6710_02660 [Nitrospirota bacterium]